MNATRWRLMGHLARKASGSPLRLANGSEKFEAVHEGPQRKRVHEVPHQFRGNSIELGFEPHLWRRKGFQLLRGVSDWARPNHHHSACATTADVALSAVNNYSTATRSATEYP
jgi:hypothetical protein